MRTWTRYMVAGLAGLATWLACFWVVMSCALQVRDGAVVPHHIVILERIAWILSIPWIWLTWLLQPAFGAKDSFAFGNYLGFLWGIVVCWGLSLLLRRLDRKAAP